MSSIVLNVRYDETRDRFNLYADHQDLVTPFNLTDLTRERIIDLLAPVLKRTTPVYLTGSADALAELYLRPVQAQEVQP